MHSNSSQHATLWGHHSVHSTIHFKWDPLVDLLSWPQESRLSHALASIQNKRTNKRFQWKLKCDEPLINLKSVPFSRILHLLFFFLYYRFRGKMSLVLTRCVSSFDSSGIRAAYKRRSVNGRKPTPHSIYDPSMISKDSSVNVWLKLLGLLVMCKDEIICRNSQGLFGLWKITWNRVK